MMKLLIFALLITFVTCKLDTKLSETVKKAALRTIVGGFKTNINDVPFQSQMVNTRNIFYCGSIIIDKCWLLTAAHCLAHKSYRNKPFKIMSASSYSGKGKMSDVENSFLHPNFKESTNEHDIGLIKLKTCLELNTDQSPVQLSNTEPKAGDVVKISGYGKSRNDRKRGSYVLKAAYVPVIGKSECQRRYAKLHRTVFDSVFCAGDGINDSCDGDSGGPVLLKDKLVGIISDGEDCSNDYYPSKYTRIDMHLDWISNVTGIDFTSQNEQVSP